jgi:hypothetical protein
MDGADAGNGGAAQTAGPVFSSSRIVRFSDLSEGEKEQYVRFFTENQVHVSSNAE